MAELKPAVLFVTGYWDSGFEKRFGCKQKELGSYASWARLLASAKLNKSMDPFISHSLQQNLDMEVINYPEGVHAFDLEDSSKASQRVIHQVVDYTKFHLQVA
jgi:hypothetical protein